LWELEHSVAAKVSSEFAWQYMTDVANWDDPPAQFELDGPFHVGTAGTTRMPGRPPIHWHIRALNPQRAYMLQMTLDRATISFQWRFDSLADAQTRLTQHIMLEGENAGAYVADMQAAFGSNLAEGMQKIAKAMEQAAQAG
jgi:hypothetical protein